MAASASLPDLVDAGTPDADAQADYLALQQQEAVTRAVIAAASRGDKRPRDDDAKGEAQNDFTEAQLKEKLLRTAADHREQRGQATHEARTCWGCGLSGPCL